MDYYLCSNAELCHEVSRRGFRPCGDHNYLSEGLRQDDNHRGTDATTVYTTIKGLVAPISDPPSTAEFGKTVPALLLVGERIIHWTMNTFFPALQLFFESGLSCTIEGSQLSPTVVGFDPKLRFRLTDCTHEEGGTLVKSTLSEKFAGPTPSIGILEAALGRRESVAVKYTNTDAIMLNQRRATIAYEAHVALGLRLEGMDQMAYVWARAVVPTTYVNERTWGDVRVAGLRDDAPAPVFGFLHKHTKPGGKAVVVRQGSMIKDAAYEKQRTFGHHGHSSI